MKGAAAGLLANWEGLALTELLPPPPAPRANAMRRPMESCRHPVRTGRTDGPYFTHEKTEARGLNSLTHFAGGARGRARPARGGIRREEPPSPVTWGRGRRGTDGM